MIITLQPSAHTDHITADGTELTQLPYPFHVDAATGLIGRQDFWRGDPLAVVGFVADPARIEIDLTWREYVEGLAGHDRDDLVPADPTSIVGMYVITRDDKGQWGTHVAAISSIRISEESGGTTGA